MMCWAARLTTGLEKRSSPMIALGDLLATLEIYREQILSFFAGWLGSIFSIFGL